MTTKAEDLRKAAHRVANAGCIDGYSAKDDAIASNIIIEYAELLEQQEKGKPVGEVICPIDEGGQRVGIYGEEIALGTLLYTHPEPAQAEQPTETSKSK